MPSFILIHPTVWPQYTNVTDSTERQRSDSIGRTVLQTVAQKLCDPSLTHANLSTLETSIAHIIKRKANAPFTLLDLPPTNGDRCGR